MQAFFCSPFDNSLAALSLAAEREQREGGALRNGAGLLANPRRRPFQRSLALFPRKRHADGFGHLLPSKGVKACADVIRSSYFLPIESPYEPIIVKFRPAPGRKPGSSFCQNAARRSDMRHSICHPADNLAGIADWYDLCSNYGRNRRPESENPGPPNTKLKNKQLKHIIYYGKDYWY